MTCDKHRFGTLKEAEDALLECKLRRMFRGRHHRREQRAYMCRDCGGFHLSSKPSRREASA